MCIIQKVAQQLQQATVVGSQPLRKTCRDLQFVDLPRGWNDHETCLCHADEEAASEDGTPRVEVTIAECGQL